MLQPGDLLLQVAQLGLFAGLDPFPGSIAEGDATGVCHEAAALAATAAAAVGFDHGVSNLAGRAGVALVQLAANDDAHPDTGAERDIHHVVSAAPSAIAMLRHHGEIGIVVEQDMLVESFGDNIAQRHLVPLRHIGAG